MKKYLIITIVLMLLFSACSTWQPYGMKSFTMHETYTSTVGSSMFTLEAGNYDSITGSKEGLVQELVYSGISGKTIKINYREYRTKNESDFIRSNFGQELNYDISESSFINFQDIKIEVLSANNSEITFKIIEWGREKEFEKIEGKQKEKTYYLQ